MEKKWEEMTSDERQEALFQKWISPEGATFASPEAEKAYKETVTLVQRTIKAFGGEELSELADKADIDGIKLGNHPVWLKAIAAIGKTMSEHNLVEGDTLRGGEKEHTL